MVNIQEFTNRLKRIMEYHQLTATLFADKIGVQRSSISHILSGRNKPSLDFVLKVTSKFLDVDIQWLINGKGNFPNTLKNVSTSTPPKIDEHSSLDNEKKIQRIIVFYTNGTFDVYK